MTRSRYRIFEDEYPYFMTWTVVGWLPLFTRSDTTDILYNCWRFLQKERDFKIFAYVILENHLHLIAAAPNLAKVVKDAKSFTARQIIDQLRHSSAETLLKQLSFHKLAHKDESDYQVWQEGSHPEQIQNDAMMWQKIEYTHNNPLRRGYVDDPLHWRHSSARNYAGLPGLIDVITDWR